MPKFESAVVKRELPSNFCHKCRRWIESQEAVNLFERVGVWTCPECRGETSPGTVTVAATVTQADVARDERLGPYRDIISGTMVLNASGKTARAKLSCGHEACVLPDAVKVRCRKCRGGVDAGFNNKHED